jgi:hypothetical protein
MYRINWFTPPGLINRRMPISDFGPGGVKNDGGLTPLMILLTMESSCLLLDLIPTEVWWKSYLLLDLLMLGEMRRKGVHNNTLIIITPGLINRRDALNLF